MMVLQLSTGFPQAMFEKLIELVDKFVASVQIQTSAASPDSNEITQGSGIIKLDPMLAGRYSSVVSDVSCET